MKYTIDRTPTLKHLDTLWYKVIKLRAGMKSEYAGGEGYICAHHIVGKPSVVLRYCLDNGVCITTGQHNYVAHNAGRSAQFREWALKKRGITEEQLKILSRCSYKPDKFMIKLYLEQKIKELEDGTR